MCLDSVVYLMMISQLVVSSGSKLTAMVWPCSQPWFDRVRSHGFTMFTTTSMVHSVHQHGLNMFATMMLPCSQSWFYHVHRHSHGFSYSPTWFEKCLQPKPTTIWPCSLRSCHSYCFTMFIATAMILPCLQPCFYHMRCHRFTMLSAMFTTMIKLPWFYHVLSHGFIMFSAMVLSCSQPLFYHVLSHGFIMFSAMVLSCSQPWFYHVLSHGFIMFSAMVLSCSQPWFYHGHFHGFTAMVLPWPLPWIYHVLSHGHLAICLIHSSWL